MKSKTKWKLIGPVVLLISVLLMFIAPLALGDSIVGFLIFVVGFVAAIASIGLIINGWKYEVNRLIGKFFNWMSKDD